MSKSSDLPQSERVLICAPFGRDGVLIRKALIDAGLTASVRVSVEELSDDLRNGAGAALITDEALNPGSVDHLAGELRKQPPWSDFPLLVMTSGGDITERSRYRLQLLAPLGNVSLLERPLRSTTLVSSVQAALRARRHQYQLATYLKERETIEAEVKQRNDELVKANNELEEFAYVVSHDLQEPLRMVKIYTQLLVRDFGGEHEKAREYVEFVQGGVGRMDRLLHDLLTLSRTIHAERSTPGAADLSRSLNQAITTLQPRIDESSAEIQFEQLPTVVGDETQLALVFQNLLSNALKYRKPGVRPTIRIFGELREGTCLVSVTDNGIGFEQEYSERIFGLFKRLHRDEYPGTGLGLAICRRIVERYGGRIWAEGHPQQGATFSFSLSCAVGD